MSYRVCIPTAGIGSRLGELTKNLNKALVTLANRPVIAHVIDEVLTNPNDEAVLEKVRKEVKKLVGNFPLYKNLVKRLER